LRLLKMEAARLRVLYLGGETVYTKGGPELILTIFAGFAQFEREMVLERQGEGIATAKGEGRYSGQRSSARLKAEDAVKRDKLNRERAQHRGTVYRALGNPATRAGLFTKN
jgi:DNA invertase Pin-like site-specific DNA recombinase